MLIAYNKKLKNPLKWRKLYVTKSNVPYDGPDDEFEENDIGIKEAENDDI
jgi:hypothetical protein